MQYTKKLQNTQHAKSGTETSTVITCTDLNALLIFLCRIIKFEIHSNKGMDSVYHLNNLLT